MKEEIIALYKRHKPEILLIISKIFDQYKDNLEKLRDSIKAKYEHHEALPI